MEEIKLKSSIKQVAIRDEDDNILTVIRIDSADNTILERFINTLNNVEKIKKHAVAEEKRLKEEYADKNDLDYVVASCKADINALQSMCNEIDALFGAGTIKDVFRLNYEINPDFVPDEMLIIDFLEGIVPIMESIYGERMDAKRQRFNVNRTGGKRE